MFMPTLLSSNGLLGQSVALPSLPVQSSGRPSTQPEVTLSPQGLAKSRQPYGLQGAALSRAEQTRDVMLSFVGQRLEQLKREGATPDKIQDTLQQALSGFQEGYRQALDQLNAGGGLSDDLANELEATRLMVLDALQGLARPSDTDAVVESGPVTSAMARLQVSFADQQRAQLSVTTQDGDTVDIVFQRDTAFQFAAAKDSRVFSEQGGSSYRLQVNGELDEAEREALMDLLQQVDTIASTFYSGDVQQAFEMASELDIDGGQLAAMSMNLRQISRFSASAAYETVQGGGASPEGLQALRGLVDGVMAALDQATHFSQPKTLLAELFGGRLAMTGADTLAQSRSQIAALLDALLASPDAE